MKKAEAIEIEASADRVWEVAAKEFDQIGTWASNVTESRASHEPVAGLRTEDMECTGRVCATPQGETKEVFVAYDARARTFTYEITGSAMPGFVERATNTWTVESLGPEVARLTMSVDMQTRGLLGAMMRPMMKVGMGKLLRVNLEELKHYIETGEQHARKQKKAAA
ncbi:MAG: SRPBCC family protein [Myxococcota bacterium]